MAMYGEPAIKEVIRRASWCLGYSEIREKKEIAVKHFLIRE